MKNDPVAIIGGLFFIAAASIVAVSVLLLGLTLLEVFG